MEASIAHNDALLRLRSSGLRISIDDFGTGYSSLDYLHRFHIDRTKIPGSFITDLCTVSSNASIMRASIGLARAPDIEVVIEGVEAAGPTKSLASWGCRVVQGFHFAKPLTTPTVTALLRVDDVTWHRSFRSRRRVRMHKAR